MIPSQRELLQVAKKAIQKWGVEKQVHHLHEEMGELMVAISHHRRGRVKVEAVQEEIADVIFMAFEMAAVYGEKGVTKFLREKVNLVKSRLNSSK